MNARRSYAPWLVLVAALVLLMLGLGRWQLARAHAKQAQIEAAAQVLQQRRTLPLAQALADGGGDLAWLVASGQFEPQPIVLDNQQRDGRSGMRVYASMRFPGHATRLLVDLGWRPWPLDRRLEAIELPRGAVAVAGLLAPPPSVGLRVGAAPMASAAPLLVTRMDMAELARATGMPLATRVLRLDPALALGYARDLDVLPNTLSPQRHRAYAVQWFAMAAALTLLSSWTLIRWRTA